MSRQADRQRALAARQMNGRARKIGRMTEGAVRVVGVEPTQCEADRVRDARAKLAADFADATPTPVPAGSRMECTHCHKSVRAKKDGTPYAYGCQG